LHSDSDAKQLVAQLPAQGVFFLEQALIERLLLLILGLEHAHRLLRVGFESLLLVLGEALEIAEHIGHAAQRVRIRLSVRRRDEVSLRGRALRRGARGFRGRRGGRVGREQGRRAQDEAQQKGGVHDHSLTVGAAAADRR